MESRHGFVTILNLLNNKWKGNEAHLDDDVYFMLSSTYVSNKNVACIICLEGGLRHDFPLWGFDCKKKHNKTKKKWHLSRKAISQKLTSRCVRFLIMKNLFTYYFMKHWFFPPLLSSWMLKITATTGDGLKYRHNKTKKKLIYREKEV